MIFGRETLLAAQDRADEAARALVRSGLDADAKVRTKRLSRTLFQLTDAEIPVNHNGITLRPAGAKHQDAFRRALILGRNYKTENLSLRTAGDRTSGWFNYEFIYAHPIANQDLPTQILNTFKASREIFSEELPPSETNLWMMDDTVTPSHLAVEYQSPQYNYIVQIAKLFFPRSVELVEG